jgi:hypothetical protein
MSVFFKSYFEPPSHINVGEKWTYAAILSSLNSNFHSLLPAQSVPKRTPTHSDQFICTISGSMVLSKLFHQCGVAWAHLPFLECAPRDLPLAFDLFLTRVRLKAATENKHKQTNSISLLCQTNIMYVQTQ